MPFLLDDRKAVFPDPLMADSNGLLAVGGSITPEFLLEAYKLGIFPWFDPDMHPPLWWFPDPRPVFFPGEVKISKSMRQWLRRHKDYKITMDLAFDQVLRHCAEQPGRQQPGRWLTETLQASLKELFRNGFARSVEVWNGRGELVGGLYGVTPGNGIFSGESMFHTEPNTSKAALIYLVQNAKKLGFRLIDGQAESEHLIRMGAKLIPAREYYKILARH